MKYPQHLLTILVLCTFVLGTGCEPDDTPAPDQQTATAENTPKPNRPKFSDGAIRTAAHDGRLDIVQQGVDDGNDLTQVDSVHGMNALHMAAFNGHVEIMDLLLAQDLNVDARDKSGKSALIHAASGPFPEAVKLLLDNGAEINLTDETEGFTALMMAAAEGQVAVVKLLIARGADPKMTDIDGDTALSFATKKGHAEVVSLLSLLPNDAAATNP